MCAAFKNKKLIVLIGFILWLSGQSVWAETSSSESTEPILLMIGKEQDLSGCELLGPVTGASEDDEGNLTYPQRMIVARDQLRAETAQLGGNAVHILRTYNTARFAVPGINQKIKFSGNAYKCK